MEEEKIQEHMMVKRSFEYLSMRRCAQFAHYAVRGFLSECWTSLRGFEKQQAPRSVKPPTMLSSSPTTAIE
jgi:hypothetical protein